MSKIDVTKSYAEQKPLYTDVLKIIGDSRQALYYDYKATLHTTDDDIEVIKVVSIDIIRDYVGKIGEEIVIKFMLPYGDYLRKLYPKRKNIEMTLKTIESAHSGYVDNSYGKTTTERYKAIFIEDMNPNDSMRLADTLDSATLNTRQAPVEVVLQLLNRTLEPLRIKTTQGIYNNVTREDLIRSILGGETYKVKIDGKPGIEALDIYKVDNNDPIKQIVIPNNTPVTSVPTFIQERHTGVYAGGIGTFFQRYDNKRTWYIYPLFDFTRFDADTRNKAVIYSSPNNRQAGQRVTYKVDGKSILIVSSGQQTYKDDGEASQMQDGVGFRQANASMMMDKPVMMKESGPVGITKRLNTEVVLTNREDNLNHAPVSSRGIANNNMAEYSRHLINNGATVMLVWNNSKHDLLYPGMPCKFCYTEGDITKEVKGIILSSHTLITTGSRSGIKITDTSYSSTTTLALFVEKYYQQGAYAPGKTTNTAQSNTATINPQAIAQVSTVVNGVVTNTTQTSNAGTITGEGKDVTSTFGPVLNQGMYYTSDGTLAMMRSVIDLGDGRLKATDVWGNTYFMPIANMIQYRPTYVAWNGVRNTTSTTTTAANTNNSNTNTTQQQTQNTTTSNSPAIANGKIVVRLTRITDRYKASFGVMGYGTLVNVAPKGFLASLVTATNLRDPVNDNSVLYITTRGSTSLLGVDPATIKNDLVVSYEYFDKNVNIQHFYMSLSAFDKYVTYVFD